MINHRPPTITETVPEPRNRQNSDGLTTGHKPRPAPHNPHPERADHVTGGYRTPSQSPTIETINSHRHQPRRWIEAQVLGRDATPLWCQRVRGTSPASPRAPRLRRTRLTGPAAG